MIQVETIVLFSELATGMLLPKIIFALEICFHILFKNAKLALGFSPDGVISHSAHLLTDFLPSKTAL